MHRSRRDPGHELDPRYLPEWIQREIEDFNRARRRARALCFAYAALLTVAGCTAIGLAICWLFAWWSGQ